MLIGTCLLFGQDGEKDELVITNGIKMFGEIKKMESDELEFGVDFGKFIVDWDKVARLNGPGFFVIQKRDGERLSGTISSHTTGELWLKDGPVQTMILLHDIESINEYESKSLARLKASIDFGFTLARANNQRQINLRASSSYYDKKWLANLSFNSFFNFQDNSDNTRRLNLDLTYRYFIKKGYFAITSLRMLQNNEQNLRLRTNGSIGAGSRLKSNDNIFLTLSSGFALSSERFTDVETPSTRSLELFVSSEFIVRGIDKLEITSAGNVYPSLTRAGRVRFDLDVELKIDLPAGFNVKFSYTQNFDSAPLDENATKNDFIFSTTVGWSL